MKVADIRSTFLNYFKQNDHEIVRSSPLVPHNDPTLLFTNAGMVQFKDYFTGSAKPTYSTAATSQKCVRAGGKHNDLENVGYTARHHTFFEMLGNFSFGDYFKEKAILLAWNLLTKEFGLEKDKLLVTVYHDDDDAANLWKKIAGFGDDKIIRIATKDNFWAMGDTGPCGPCSEIFYDHGPDIWGGVPGSPEQDGDRFIEIWNLVFMQFEQVLKADGSTEMIALPKPSIDTGMGLERISAVLQHQHNNYDIDLFQHIIETSKHLTKTNNESSIACHRVIADHLRSSSFLISDGVLPSNEGRGYVLRRIMRRAMRQVHKLGYKDLLMHQLVPVLVQEMGDAYPDLVAAQPLITETLKLEEERFQKTLDRGISLLNEESKKVASGASLPGSVAFKLYDTYGFPLDLTQDIMRGEGKTVDVSSFDSIMEEQKALARASWVGSGEAKTDPVWFEIRQTIEASEFLGYSSTRNEAQILGIVKDGALIDTLEEGDSASLILNQTPFYAESGGQIGDQGILTSDEFEFKVDDTQKRAGDLIVHIGTVTKGQISKGNSVLAGVDEERRNQTRAHHSATHLLHKALRETLGEHVTQKGSMVTPDRLRFDFSHNKQVSLEELYQAEHSVNNYIRQNTQVETQLKTPEQAKEEGAMALFGEKYGESVRVVSMGQKENSFYSKELCGGTHVSSTGDIGFFKIISESSVGAGVRRIEAVVAEAAFLYVKQNDEQLTALADRLKCNKAMINDKIEALFVKIKQLEKGEKQKTAVSGEPKIWEINGIKLAAQIVNSTENGDLRALSDTLKAQIKSGVVIIFGKGFDKVSIIVAATPDSNKNAVDIVRSLSKDLGGAGGGGRPDFAQAGGFPEKLEDVFSILNTRI